MRFACLAALLALSFSSPCAAPTVEEVTFRSGAFTVVGDLRLPDGPGPHPVVVFVHGDGPNNRTAGVTYPPIMARMLRAGYATLAWDKPGTGKSTGQIDRTHLIDQRAAIVLDALRMLKARPDIDPARIGLWGISQAGYVMPRVLERSSNIAFMIAVSCAGGPGVEQGIYLLAAQMVCAGRPADSVGQLRDQIRAFTMAATYEQYVRQLTPLLTDPAFRALARFGQRVEVAPKQEWHPADPAREYYGFDPMAVIRRTRIPILAVFGARDTQVDPVQGAQAWREALAHGGNPLARVAVFPGTDHNIVRSETGCVSERNSRSAAGWKDYPPEYLDLIERWLKDLAASRKPVLPPPAS